MRLFVAINLTDDLREKVKQIQKDIVETGADLKLVAKENLHFTLKFIGEVKENQLDNIKSVIGDAVSGIDCFSVTISGIGAFPSNNDPRVLWLGVDKGKDKVSLMAKRINEELNKLGFSEEKRGFSTHLTLARVRSNRVKQKLVNKLKSFRDMANVGEMEIREITLMQSELTRSGPIYKSIEVFSLSR